MDNRHILEFHGEIDFLERDSIEREFDRLALFGDDAVTILDLSDVRYFDTTFLNALVRIDQQLKIRKPDARICLVAPRANIMWRLFEITQLDSVFQLFEDVASATSSSTFQPLKFAGRVSVECEFVERQTRYSRDGILTNAPISP